MDKTISISLGGFSFIIDDPAYEKLKNYLNDIRLSLKGMEGTDEIMADVEVRIAEIFKERLGVREVVNELDVDHIVSVMGQPEQYVDEEVEETDSTSQNQAHSGFSSSSEQVKRKLYRDPDNKVVGGVLAGLAHYLGVDTWMTRVGWIVLLFADIPITGTSFTVVSYLILWMALPLAQTATQKYEMFGQAGNFESIKKNAGVAAGEMRNIAGKTSDSFGDFLRIVGKLILIFFGFWLVVGGFATLIGAIITLIGSAKLLPGIFISGFVDYPWQSWAGRISIFLLVLIPSILLILLGAKMISNRVKVNKGLGFGLLGLWFLALITVSVLAFNLSRNFDKKIESSDKKAYSVSQDTIQIAFSEMKTAKHRNIRWSKGSNINFDDWEELDGQLVREIEDDIEVLASPNDQLFVEVIYSAKGASTDDAKKNTESIVYKYSMNSNGELQLNNFISLAKNSKLRSQDVSIVLYVPKDKVLYFRNIDDVIFYDELTKGKNYEDGNNKFYKFVDTQFKCLNCNAHSTEKMEKTQETKGIKISRDGIRIQDEGDKIIIDKNKIKISDDSDSIVIDFSDN